jgi:hypothetical protein
VTEKMPDPDAIPDDRDKGFFRSLSVEEPPPPRFLYFNRQMAIDARISTALAFWCMRGNRAVSSAGCRWKSVEGESRSGKRCLWSDIVRLAKAKSEIIADEAEYWERVDPSRGFREMDLKNTATKMEELDEETSCSESEEEEDGGSDDGESDEEEEGEGMDQDVPLEPAHNPVFKSIVNDSYAMAILHLTATEFPDDSLDDFELFKDSRSISTE